MSACTLGKIPFTVTVLSWEERRFSLRVTEGINQGFLKRSETQNNHQACPRKIFQKAVVAVKFKHAAIAGELSVNWHCNYYVKGKGKFYMWICLVNRFTAAVTWDGCSVPKLQSAVPPESLCSTHCSEHNLPTEKVLCHLQKEDGAFVLFCRGFLAIFVIPDCKLWDKQMVVLGQAHSWLHKMWTGLFFIIFKSWLACASVHASSYKSRPEQAGTFIKKFR